MQQPSLDHRHRDKDGTIARKHGNTLIGTLRRTYGQHFAGEIADTEKLEASKNGFSTRHDRRLRLQG
jgi:hypothetical protein